MANTDNKKNEEKGRRFLVVGAGGTGGHLLGGLSRIVEYKYPGSAIVIVDGDTFEPRNAERQEFTQLGNKAVVKADELRPYFMNTIFIEDPRWVVENSPEGSEDTVSASELMNEGDVVYAMVDNFAARKALFDAAKEFDNIDVFTGGNDEHLDGSTYHYCRRDGKDVTDHPAIYHEELENPPDRNPGELSCAERAALEGGVQTIAANMTVAAILLSRTHKVIIEGAEDTEAEIVFDMDAGLTAAFDYRAEVSETSEEKVEEPVA